MSKLSGLFSAAFIIAVCALTPDPKKRVPHSGHAEQGVEKAVKKVCSHDTVVNAGNGFKICYREQQVTGTRNSDVLLTVKYNGQQVYVDSSTVYVLNDSLNPALLSFGNGFFELFLEIDNHPNKNYLKTLQFQSGKIVDSLIFPTFFAKPSHLFSDKQLHLAGVWDYGESWTDSNNVELTDYNPILYYEVSNSGLVLDSFETIKKNKEIYGKFHGYDINERIAIPAIQIRSRHREIKRIEEHK